MLEKIMDLQILLYSMAALGTLGAIGMLTTNLTYRRMLKSTGSKNTGTKNTQGAGSSQRISLKEKWLRLWKTRDRLLHRMNRLVWYPALLSTVILGCAIYFSKTLRIEEGLPLTYLYVGATVPVVLLLLRQAFGFFLQRRAGDGYVGRLCGADEKLDRRDSSREKTRTLFYRKKSWIRLPVASSRQLLPEVISVRC